MRTNVASDFEAFDPIFEYKGRTYAEMDPAQKVSLQGTGASKAGAYYEQNVVSERYKGLAKLKEWLVEDKQT